MTERELIVESEGIAFSATLTVPTTEITGVIVLLHGATNPSRDFFLFRHLAGAMPKHGLAVLRYDRRPSPNMVPLATQVIDALAAVRRIRCEPEFAELPVGLWGFSQGAWTALITASEHLDTAFLILVGFSAVSPSRQMRYSAENSLRSAGFGKEAVDKLAELRNLWEAYRRGDIPRNLAQGRIDEFASLPWFKLAYVPKQVPERSNLGDPDFFDFDPAVPLARIRCPLLVLCGAGDIEVPVEESRAIITAVTDAHGFPETTMHCYPGVGHFLTRDDQEEITALAPHYESDLIRWVQQQFAGLS